MSGSKHSSSIPLMDFSGNILHKLHDNGWHLQAKPFLIIFAIINVLFFLYAPRQTVQNFSVLLFMAPLWIPYILVTFSFVRFLESRRAEFIANQEHVLLELRMPRDTKKTPLAMETIFANLHLSPGETTWYKVFLKGGVRPSWSFEIVSIGGQVRFFVWTREGFRRGLESFFYGQYPDMEIIEAEDYSLLFDPVSHDNEMWGTEFTHTKENPYPIKTYIDYGLDKAGAKPEEQVDPLSQLIEYLGSLGPKEQFWIQIIIRVTKGESYKGRGVKKGFNWTDEGKEIIEEIRQQAVKKTSRTDPATGKTIVSEGFPNPTKGQLELIAAIDRNTAKQGFDVGIRSIYTAPKDAFRGINISLMLGMFKPFNSEEGNGLKTATVFSAKYNDYPWEDPGGHHKHHDHEQITEYYRRRSYFHTPYTGPWMVMSTEELATLFHVPSGTTTTPNLPRIQSTTKGAPPNLPT